jgi:sterol 3beta-glucosyltransferase
MMIPIKDILSTQPHKAYRIGHAGLLLLLRGHEELFLEFSSKERRHHCVTALEAQIEEMERLAKEDERAGRSRANTREAIILEELDHSISSDGQPQPPQSALPNNDGPSVGLFASTTSTLLDFKPSQPMTITCLTIGSRGDVQPYIALCKGLQAEVRSLPGLGWNGHCLTTLCAHCPGSSNPYCISCRVQGLGGRCR